MSTNQPPPAPPPPPLPPPRPGDGDAYLWDRSGAADPVVARLERTMAPLRHRGTAPVVAVHGRTRWRPLLAAAAIVLAVAGIWYGLRPAPTRPAPPLPAGPGWAMTVPSGAPLVEGVKGIPAELQIGRWLTTPEGTQVQLSVFRDSNRAKIVVESGSRVRLRAADGEAARLEIEHGTVFASTFAAEVGLGLDSAGGRIDIAPGTAARISVPATGAGRIELKTGTVTVVFDGRVTRIPAGATCRLDPGHGPGTPVFFDTPAAVLAAVTRIDDMEGMSGKSKQRSLAAEEATRAATARDAVTLWNLLSRVGPEDREVIADRLATLVPLAQKIPPSGLIKLESNAMDAYWEAAVIARSGR